MNLATTKRPVGLLRLMINLGLQPHLPTIVLRDLALLDPLLTVSLKSTSLKPCRLHTKFFVKTDLFLSYFTDELRISKPEAFHNLYKNCIHHQRSGITVQ